MKFGPLPSPLRRTRQMTSECNYVYRVTHIPTGQHYIGSRKSRGLPAYQDLGKRYFTSSKDVRSLFMSAPHEFRIRIVSEHPTYRDAFLKEQRYLARTLGKYPLFNKARFFGENWATPEIEEKRQKARQRLAQDAAWRKRNSDSHKGHIMTPETREKIRRAMIGNKNSQPKVRHAA